MLVRVLCLLLLGLSGTAFAKTERLQLDRFPSTYLSDCEGIAYIYKVKNKLRLGIRAVKNCGRIEIDGLMQKMERYDLGYRFETRVSTNDATRVKVFSRRNQFYDEFIIGTKRKNPGSESPPGTQNQSLQVLKACGESFQSSSMINFCHEKLKASKLNLVGVARVCAKRSFTSAQKTCLQESLKFAYRPVEVMRACDENFDRNSDIDKCYSTARQYSQPPLKIFQQCHSMYDRNSQKFNCMERFAKVAKPIKALELLQACKSQFTRYSSAEKCFDKSNLIPKSKKKTLMACSQGFQRESSKFECLDLAAKIQVDPAGVVTECSARQQRTSEALKCIAKFSSDFDS